MSNLQVLALLLAAVTICQGRKMTIYGRLEKLTATWDTLFDRHSTFQSGTAIWEGKEVPTYVCRLWRNKGTGYIRVGRYIPEAHCCALSFKGGKTQCSMVQVEFLQECPPGSLVWEPAENGEFDLEAHRGIIIGGSREYKNQYICRFPWEDDGQTQMLQGRLNLGDEVCSGVINVGNSNQEEVSSNEYEILKGHMGMLLEG